VGPRAGMDGRKVSSPPGFDPGPSSPYSVGIPTELPGPHNGRYKRQKRNFHFLLCGIYDNPKNAEFPQWSNETK